jgi:hypothetical protein
MPFHSDRLYKGENNLGGIDMAMNANYGNIELLSSLVMTSNNLLSLAERDLDFRANLEETFILIMEEIGFNIRRVPDILMADSNRNNSKKKMLTAYDEAIENYYDHEVSDLDFNKSWGKFNFRWQEYLALINHVNNSKHSIMLSLN